MIYRILKSFTAAAAKTQLGTTLANVDWLHGPAESLLTITNLFIGAHYLSAHICIHRNVMPALLEFSLQDAADINMVYIVLPQYC